MSFAPIHAKANPISLDSAGDFRKLRGDLAPRIPLAFANAKKKGAPVPPRPDAPFSFPVMSSRKTA